MYELGMRGVQTPQAEGLELQQKIASGRRVLKPSDDPIAAAAAIGLQQSKAVNTQYGVNAQNASSSLNLELESLGDATGVLQDIKELVVKAGNPGLQNSDRQSIATEAQGLYDQLLGIANRTDGDGKYMFAGFHTDTQPFSEQSPRNVVFNGDEGQRFIQVGPQRKMPIGDSGTEIFLRMKEGNGTFTAKPAALNAGGGIAGPGSVRNAAAWTGDASKNYTVRFAVSNATPPVTTYDIVDNTTNTSKLTGLAAVASGPYSRTYTTGMAIDLQSQGSEPAFDAGVQLDITGAPADGDTFAVKPAPSQDIFSTLHSFITTLNNGMGTGTASKANYQSALNNISSSLDRGLDQVLTTRAAVGIRLAELDSVQQTTEDMNLHYSEDLSRLQDLDYAQALTQLSQKQFSLEAAQKSFVAVSNLKLFDFL
jgi:flagellar hook-associated protein 3 FlgL